MADLTTLAKARPTRLPTGYGLAIAALVSIGLWVIVFAVLARWLG